MVIVVFVSDGFVVGFLPVACHAVGERCTQGTVEASFHENNVLKRAVSIQHERQKEFEDRTWELHHLKLLAPQCQEQLRTLEAKMPNVKLLKYMIFTYFMIVMF